MPKLNSPTEVVLVTGGTGHIGSHTVVALIAAGYEPVLVDNLMNSKDAVLERLTAITKMRHPLLPDRSRLRVRLSALGG